MRYFTILALTVLLALCSISCTKVSQSAQAEGLTVATAQSQKVVTPKPTSGDRLVEIVIGGKTIEIKPKAVTLTVSKESRQQLLLSLYSDYPAIPKRTPMMIRVTYAGRMAACEKKASQEDIGPQLPGELFQQLLPVAYQNCGLIPAVSQGYGKYLVSPQQYSSEGIVFHATDLDKEKADCIPFPQGLSTAGIYGIPYGPNYAIFLVVK